MRSNLAELKAFLTSNVITTQYSFPPLFQHFSSRAFLAVSVTSLMASTVDLSLLKPYWLFARPLSYVYFCSLLQDIPSNTLPDKSSKYIGLYAAVSSGSPPPFGRSTSCYYFHLREKMPSLMQALYTMRKASEQTLIVCTTITLGTPSMPRAFWSPILLLAAMNSSAVIAGTSSVWGGISVVFLTPETAW